eukprot:TRINITY_DN1243_c0_g2_i9.p1 TRINITY_DN1243_c0_g2~~TRINITY_DN1243_c0_g2_i9.p1  ORF type:complete len:310 (+),score=35.29 TRINITY_DN1243_c0_g2_i9:58-987(+)
MECVCCGVSKLRNEFPSSPTSQCRHPSLHCFKCLLEKLGDFPSTDKFCPDCNMCVSEKRYQQLKEQAKFIWFFEDLNISQSGETEGKDTILVRQLDGSTTRVPYSSDLTISTLKFHLEMETGIPAECQRLMYDGNLLEGIHDLLSEHHVLPGTIIYLLSLFGSVYEEAVHMAIDISLSMNTFLSIGRKSITRLDFVKDELTKIISNFGHDKKINLYAFGSHVECWSYELQTCNANNKSSAIQWVKNLRASGTTALDKCLQEIEKCDSSVRTIYILSDGSPNDQSQVLNWLSSHPKVVVNTTCFFGNVCV